MSKQSLSDIDYFDVGISALSGNWWGQVGTGVIGGLFDYSGAGEFRGPSGKSNYQLGVDVITGAIFGGLGVGIGNHVNSAWQTAAGFLNQLTNEAFNWTLSPTPSPSRN